MSLPAILEPGPQAAPRRRPTAHAKTDLPASIHVAELGCVALAATLVPVSLIWDFSWEASIGADRFWSPPHLALHTGIWLSGLLAAWLVFRFTSAHRRGLPAAAVEVGPFCAPAGAWVLLWSAATLQMAFLFDSWWQQAYGLGAGLWHPPQILKAIGFFGLQLGALLLAATTPPGSLSHGTSLSTSARLGRAWHGGLLVTMSALVLTMTNFPNLQHTNSFFLVSCGVYPAVLVMTSQPGQNRWSTCGTAVCYMLLTAALIWILPLFPAHPLTPPVYNPTDHFMPPAFPLLLVLPALAMDLAGQRFAAQTARSVSRPSRSRLRELCQAGACGLAFSSVFLPVQWFFAGFLLSPHAKGWLFAGGGQHWPYFLKIDQAKTLFWGTQTDAFTWRTVLGALLLATSSSWFGLRAGGCLNKVCR